MSDGHGGSSSSSTSGSGGGGGGGGGGSVVTEPFIGEEDIDYFDGGYDTT